MIHVYAISPELVVAWSRREEFRYIRDKFGLGTPRAMLELPKFTKWKRAVHEAAVSQQLKTEDMKRLEELFRLLGDRRCQRPDSLYDELVSWLENAEREYERKPFAAILAPDNPRSHGAIIVGDRIGDSADPRWDQPTALTPARTPEALALALSAMLANCRTLHLIDPHFGPENPRHRKVLESLMSVLARNQVVPAVVQIHCLEKSKREFFESSAKQMAQSLPSGISVRFRRWRQKDGGERLHNRYILTDLGGLALGIGLDAGGAGETDDLMLLSRAQYEYRWTQYVDSNGVFELADEPAPVVGQAVARQTPTRR